MITTSDRRSPDGRGHRIQVCRVSLTAQGLYYTFVVLFILGGAILREVNLLVLLAGLMLAPLLFSWRLCRRGLLGLFVSRKLPERVFADSRFTVGILIENQRRRLAPRAVMVEDCITDSDGQKIRVRGLATGVSPGNREDAGFQVRIPDRGRYTFGPLAISTRYPLGLLQSRHVLSHTRTLLVRPRLGTLTPAWSRQFRSGFVGQQQAHRRRGLVEGDYYGLREWRPGDSRRWIHWRTSARLNDLAVRQFEQRRHQQLLLVVDLWQPDPADDDDRARVEWAVSFAATAVVDLCRRQAMHVSLDLLGAEHDHWSAGASPLLAQILLDQMAVVRGGSRFEPADLQETIALRQPARGQNIVVISTRPTPADTSEEVAIPGVKITWLSPGPSGRDYFTAGTNADIDAMESVEPAAAAPSAATPPA